MSQDPADAGLLGIMWFPRRQMKHSIVRMSTIMWIGRSKMLILQLNIDQHIPPHLSNAYSFGKLA